MKSMVPRIAMIPLVGMLQWPTMTPWARPEMVTMWLVVRTFVCLTVQIRAPMPLLSWLHLAVRTRMMSGPFDMCPVVTLVQQAS